MSFRDFTFPQVVSDLSLKLRQSDLFSGVAPEMVRPAFAELIAEGVPLAVDIQTEKARSEFIIAPILGELRHSLGRQISIFSGVELDVDAARGLNGICDFLISKSPVQVVVTAPIVAIAEAKPDIPRTGFGQCISAMVAAQSFNRSMTAPPRVIHGAATSGTAWRFLRLESDILSLDTTDYLIDNLGKIMGILKAMVTAA